MDIQFLKTFLDIADTHNFTQSAERLGYAQSSVTAQVQKLESAYGSPLFERIGKKMSLTQAGEELLRYASPIVKLYEESLVAVKRPCTGNFSIATYDITLTSYLLPHYLGLFKQAYPQVSLALHETGEKDLLRVIRTGESDMGLVVGPITEEPDIVFEQVREEAYVVIARPDHPLADCGLIRPGDIPRQDVIMTQAGCMCRSLWEDCLRALGVAYHVVYEISNFEAVKNCVLHGLGISLVPRSIVRKDVEQGRLSILAIEGLDVRMPLSFIYHNRKRLSPPMRYFMESLRN